VQRYHPWRNLVPVTNDRCDSVYIFLTILNPHGLPNQGKSADRFQELPFGSFVWSGLYACFAQDSQGNEFQTMRIPYVTAEPAIDESKSYGPGRKGGGFGFSMDVYNLEPAFLGERGLALGRISNGPLGQSLAADRRRHSVAIYIPGSFSSHLDPSVEKTCEQITAKAPRGSVEPPH